MRVLLNTLSTNFNIKNFYTQSNIKRTQSLILPAFNIKNTGLKNDQVTFCADTNKMLQTMQTSQFKRIDELLNEIENGTFEDIETILSQISKEAGKIKRTKTNNLTSLALAIKERADKNIPEFKDSLIKEEGPFDMKNLTEYKDGVIKEYKEGYQKTKGGNITIERVVSFWPNGNLMHYTKGYRENNGRISSDMDAFFDPKGNLDLYREGYKECNSMPIKIERQLKYRSGKLSRFIKDYSSDENGTKTGAEIKFLKGKPVFVSINGKTLL